MTRQGCSPPLLPLLSLLVSFSLLPQKLQQTVPGSLSAAASPGLLSRRGRSRCAYYPTCSGSHVGCNNQGRTDGVMSLECSIHGTIPLPGGGSSCTGLYPSACGWVPKRLKTGYKLLHCQTNYSHVIHLITITLFKGPLKWYCV